MARPKKRPYWRERVNALCAKGEQAGQRPSGKTLFHQFKQEATKKGGPSDYPSERTLTSYIADWIELKEARKAFYRDFRWPESMIFGVLPWESSQAALELLAWWHGRGHPSPPRNGLVKWYWRLSIAGPETGKRWRIVAAALLFQQEAYEWPDLATFERQRRAIEGWLAKPEDPRFLQELLESAQTIELGFLVDRLQELLAAMGNLEPGEGPLTEEEKAEAHERAIQIVETLHQGVNPPKRAEKGEPDNEG